MRPATYNFTLTRGGTPFLGVRLHGRDPRTQQVARLPVPGVVVEWSIAWAGSPEAKTTADGGGLAIDPRTGVITYPLSEANVAALNAASAPIPHSIRIVMSDGFFYPFLVGGISLES